jgi:thiamine pyrophosphate-dependent acetolactate synthase large subunit-like protein
MLIVRTSSASVDLLQVSENAINDALHPRPKPCARKIPSDVAGMELSRTSKTSSIIANRAAPFHVWMAPAWQEKM